jgi:septum formation protein
MRSCAYCWRSSYIALYRLSRGILITGHSRLPGLSEEDLEIITLRENWIYLASRSPRRQQLLSQIGVNFEVLSLREAVPRGADVDETPLRDEIPLEYTRRLARVKAEMGRFRLIQRRLPERPVLAADTAVVLGKRILGKPAEAAHAREMLEALSGQTHHVLTAIAVATHTGVQVRTSTTMVQFRDITESEIRGYLACSEAQDKAGAYGIQGRAAVFISAISGSYSGVVGLPLFETAQLLEEHGIPLFT